MILSDAGIKQALRDGLISIDPPPQDHQYTTSAVDLFLGRPDSFYVWDQRRFAAPGVTVPLNLAEHQYQATAAGYRMAAQPESDGSFILKPNGFLLALTNEVVTLTRPARLAARVEGRSSLARVGLGVHITAPIIHAGFSAAIALEMVNHGPFHLKLVPLKTRICQLVFERLESEPAGEITTAFQGQQTP